MHDVSNQLPPEFGHLRDDEFPDVIIPQASYKDVASYKDESSYKDDTEHSLQQKIKSTLGLTLSKSLLGLAGLVCVVLVAKQFIHPSTQSVADHYQALEQIDADTQPQINQSTIEQPKLSENANNQTKASQHSTQHYEMAQADVKRDEATEFVQGAEAKKDERINQRLSLVEDAVQKILISNEAHAQSIELLRNEQAQLMVKMQGNDSALANLRGRVDLLQNKLTRPKSVAVVSTQLSPVSLESIKQGDKIKSARSEKIAVVKPVEVAPVALVPAKPKTQLPSGIRLVSLKNLNGKNTAVLRINGDFSPLLFEGQSWQGIQILNASVHDRSAQVLFQGDEFGLVL